MTDRSQSIGEWFRFITPVLITVSLFYLSQISSTLAQIDRRLYEHQTNADIHLPRSEVVRIETQIGEMRREIVGMLKRP